VCSSDLTLHTNDAPSTILRLRDIGVEPYMIASTVTGVMAQRLLRLLCPSCKEAYQPPLRALKKMFPNIDAEDNGPLYRPKGCPECNGSGYHGRVGVYEFLVVTEEMRALIQDNAPIVYLRKQALAQGLRELHDGGMDLVRQGMTTVEEVVRHTMT
jgi:type II secretory ATPase GspE/PulE/Tfp pilus assembly ATPase PilB-like protein